MHKKSQMINHNYKKEAKKQGTIYILLVCISISTLFAYFCLKDLQWEEHVSLTRGFMLFSDGLIFFPCLFLLLNHLQTQTNTGKKFAKKYKLNNAQIYDISNKLVSAVQAFFCSLTGLTSITYSCFRDILKTSHYASEAYAWFGASYFLYDIWSMYRVYSTKLSQSETIRTKDVGTETRVLQYLKSNFMIVFHHIFIGGFGFLVITHLRGGLGDCFFGFIYLMEASTPFVSLRGILSLVGLKHSKLYIANGITMLITFFLFRIAMFPYVINLFAQAINVGFFEAVCRLPRNCLISIALLLFPQIYWFCLMMNGATKILFAKSDKSNTNNNINKVKKKEKYY